MKKRRRLLTLGLSLGLGASACSTRQETSPQQQKEAPAPTKAPVISAAEIAEKIAQAAIYPYKISQENFAQKVLYTWTTPEQIEALRQDQQLLVRTESPSMGPSGFDQRLDADGGELAKLLKTPHLSLRRFAWTNAWAAILGFKGESYGNQLLKITLKEDALIASFTPAQKTLWRLADLKQGELPMEAATRSPEKLAAIYYEATGENGEPLYREYVLCNESMIESWEYATTSVLDDLTKQEDVLRKMIDWAKADPTNKKLSASFEATTAFSGSPYTAAVADLSSLADLLLTQRSSQSGALTVKPSITFSQINPPAPKAAPATPAYVCNPSETYCPPPPPKPKKRPMGTF